MSATREHDRHRLTTRGNPHTECVVPRGFRCQCVTMGHTHTHKHTDTHTHTFESSVLSVEVHATHGRVVLTHGRAESSLFTSSLRLTPLVARGPRPLQSASESASEPGETSLTPGLNVPGTTPRTRVVHSSVTGNPPGLGVSVASS